MRLSQNKRTKSYYKEKEKQSKLIKLHNGGSTCPGPGLGPHVAPLRQQRPSSLCRNVAGHRGESVCVWSVFGVCLECC